MRYTIKFEGGNHWSLLEKYHRLLNHPNLAEVKEPERVRLRGLKCPEENGND